MSIVSVQLNSVLQKAVGHTQERPRINAALVRISMVSKVHGQIPPLKGDLVNVMYYSNDIARRSYFLQKKSKNAGMLNALAKKNHGNLIKKHFKEEIKKKKVILSMVRKKRTALSDL